MLFHVAYVWADGGNKGCLFSVLVVSLVPAIEIFAYLQTPLKLFPRFRVGIVAGQGAYTGGASGGINDAPHAL